MVTDNTSAPRPLISNRVYDYLKFIIGVLLPGVGALYFAVAQIWGFPNSEGVNGTINAIVLFLSLVVAKSTQLYNRSDAKYDGTIEVEDKAGTKVFSLGLNTDPNDLETKQAVLFRIDNK